MKDGKVQSPLSDFGAHGGTNLFTVLFDQFNVPLCKKQKSGQKTIDCVFLGYAHNSAACKCLVIKFDFPDVHINTMTDSCDAIFKIYSL